MSWESVEGDGQGKACLLCTTRDRELMGQNWPWTWPSACHTVGTNILSLD
jgi:hypothetical protein